MTLGLRDFVDAIGLPAAWAGLTSDSGAPVVLVNLDADVRLPQTVPAGLSQALPAVVVGVGDRSLSDVDGRLIELFDVVCRDPGPVVATAEQCPMAAVTLALVLRATSQLTVPAALAVESAAYSTLLGGPEFARWRASRPPRVVEADHGPVVVMERTAASLRITLSRPSRHNALNAALRDQLHEALVTAASDPSIEEVILDGAGPSFCSGGDLDEFGNFPDPVTAHLARLERSSGLLLWGLDDRVKARLHGACMGAGIELPAFTRHVVADPASVIALPELSMGLIPGAGGTVSLSRRIGRHRTAELALTQMRLDATTALSWGIVDEIAEVRPASV